jgi:hypothetical protein
LESEDENEQSKTNRQVEHEALASFVQKKAEIDVMLTRLQALSDDYFATRRTKSPGAMSAPWSTTLSC